MEHCQTAVLLENKRPDVQCDAFLDGECRSREIAIDRKRCRDCSPARRIEPNMNRNDARARLGHFTDAVCQERREESTCWRPPHEPGYHPDAVRDLGAVRMPMDKRPTPSRHHGGGFELS